MKRYCEDMQVLTVSSFTHADFQGSHRGPTIPVLFARYARKQLYRSRKRLREEVTSEVAGMCPLREWHTCVLADAVFL